MKRRSVTPWLGTLVLFLSPITAPRAAEPPVLGLYDLTQDIGETRDLSSTQPERVKQLQAAWACWRKDVEGDKPAADVKIKDVNNSP